MEFRLRRKDGTEVWFHAAISPLRDAEGQFAGALGLFADITERRRADEALRQSERQARLLADSMPHIVWTARGDGTVDYFNGRWYEYTGMSPEESLEHPGWRLAVHPDDLGPLLNVRDPAVEEGQVFQADVRLRDREGAYRWHMVRSVPVRDDVGPGDPAVRHGHRHRRPDAGRGGTRAGEHRFRFLAESIPQMVWTASPMARWTIPAPGSSSSSAPCAEQVEGRAWMDLIHADDRESGRRRLETRAPRGDQYRVECRLRTAHGEYRWFLGHALPQRDDTGRIARWYGTWTDIDLQWQAQQEIVRLNRDLRARVDELETIFATVPIGIAISEDVDCARIRSNPAQEQMLELAPGSNASLSAPAEERPEHFRFRRGGRDLRPDELPMQVAAREGQAITGCELEMCCADGRTKWFYGNATPLFDEGGQPRGSVGAFLDMTEWRRVEAALKENEEQLRLAIQATDLGLFDRDLTTNTLRWSDRSKAIFGLPPDYPITLDEFYRRLHPEDRPRVQRPSSAPWTPTATASTRPITSASGMTGPSAG